MSSKRVRRMGPPLLNAPQSPACHLGTYFTRGRKMCVMPAFPTKLHECLEPETSCLVFLAQLVLNEFLVNTGEVFKSNDQNAGSHRGINQCIFICDVSSKTNIFLIYKANFFILYMLWSFGWYAEADKILEMMAISLAWQPKILRGLTTCPEPHYGSKGISSQKAVDVSEAVNSTQFHVTD